MSFESLKPPQIPSSPPIVLNIIDEKEKALSPQSIEMKLPIVDPAKTPIQMRLLGDM